MASNINNRIEKLRARRSGYDSLQKLSEEAKTAVILSQCTKEPWESRASGKPFTRYALGAMQAVDSNYTRISIETAQRVGNQLYTRLGKSGIDVEFRLQGSVPLNVHIRGVSDVDLLVLDKNFLVYEYAGVRAKAGFYIPVNKSSLAVLYILRCQIEEELPKAFPATTVDVTGDKAVKISGGSLARPVDVVPAHWWDTVAYQASHQECDRGTKILNKSKFEVIENLPFLHIDRVGKRCDALNGTLRKSIRLCKNIKADAVEEGTVISLSSFDIASAMYHADQDALRLGYIYELAILAETQRHLSYLVENPYFAKTLRVPDDSRLIFDSEEKMQGLKALSKEVDEVVRQVAKEQRSAYLSPSVDLQHDRDLIKSQMFF